MAFKKLKPRVRPRFSAPASFGFLSNGGKLVGTLTLNQSVLDKLKWKLHDHVDVAIGDGDDEGYMLVSPSFDGPYRVTAPGGRKDHTKVRSAKIRISGLSSEDQHDSQPVEFEVLEEEEGTLKELLVTLPDFALAAIKKQKRSMI